VSKQLNYHQLSIIIEILSPSDCPTIVVFVTNFPIGVSVTFLFYPNRPGGHTLQAILMQNGSNDVGWSKNRYFLLPLTPDPKTAKICAILVGTRSQIFLSAFGIKILRGGLRKSDVNGSKLQQLLITMQNSVAFGREL